MFFSGRPHCKYINKDNGIILPVKLFFSVFYGNYSDIDISMLKYILEDFAVELNNDYNDIYMENISFGKLTHKCMLLPSLVECRNMFDVMFKPSSSFWDSAPVDEWQVDKSFTTDNNVIYIDRFKKSIH